MLPVLVLAAMAGAASAIYAQYRQSELPVPAPAPLTVNPLEAAADSTMLPFPIGYTVPPDVDYMLNREFSADLSTPSNITTVPEYDPITGYYVIHTRVGDMDVTTPFILTPSQYNDWQIRQSMLQYYRARNAETLEQQDKQPFNIFDMNFALGPLEKIFGPGGVKLKLQGSLQLKLGITSNFTDNPALNKQARRRTYFDFDQKIQATINASVGNRLKFNMNYNTDATFEFDQQNLKLGFEGEEDDIVKSIEAGNVSMTTGSSLIRGSTALFGFKSQLQFGKLTATALISQQKSSSVSVSSQGGVQTTDFEVNVHDYDANRHFFLSHFFYDNYDEFCANLPFVNSGIEISNVEVWVTNQNTNFNQSRNIVAYVDLAESETANLQTPTWVTSYTPVPCNASNNLYQTITNTPGTDNINTVESSLAALGLHSGTDFAKIENARLLSSSEYTVNKKLGYISLRTALKDEVLGVAFQYTYKGKVYTVGELSSQQSSTAKVLNVKLLKATQSTPELKTWKLMMRNVYSLGAYSMQKNNFKLDVKYLNSSQGNVLQNYLPVSGLDDMPLLQVLRMDRLDSNLEGTSDGFFDYIEGYTVNSTLGKIYFPVVEPFGQYLADVLREKSPATDVDSYCYWDLYNQLQSENSESRNSNIYVLRGHYQASSGATISLNATNVPRGSVVVTAGGVQLTEGSDYSVDYAMGIVTILNQSIIDSGQNVSVSLENQNLFSMQRKTLMGLDLNYQFNKDFNIGATLMHYSEKALTEKVNIGNEVVNNTIWGINFSYKSKFNWLTNLLNKIPTVNATAPSTFSIQGEFAHLIPHTNRSGSNAGSSFIDDFESTLYGIDLRAPSSWQLASSPFPGPITTVDGLTGDLESGKRRALLNWYFIDQLFTSPNSNSAPPGVRGNKEMLSNPYIREVRVEEVYPGRTITYGETNIIQTLNLTYYPGERGPYNVNERFFPAADVTPDFRQGNWGGIMRKLDNTDFEASNIEYLQFWLMDPYMDWRGDGTEIPSGGGKIVLQFGDISEDVLRDGRKSYENGVPVDGNGNMDRTVWGRVATHPSLTYAFDNNKSARVQQDLGLDALSDDQEHEFPTYQNYISRVRNRVGSIPDEVREDPAGDNYHYFLGSDYDALGLGVLERYKRYNGLQGNSLPPDDAPYSGYQSSRNTPDVEDINQDNTLNESNNYFEYVIQFPEGRRELQVGDCDGYLTEVNSTQVLTQDGKMQDVKWYCFKVPLSQYTSKVGNIKNFSSVRFLRMYLTNFDAITHLRFASFELMRGEWRPYKYRLDTHGSVLASGTLTSSVVNIEENSTKRPVNYVLPPGVTREIDGNDNNATQLNEQSLALTIKDLPAGDSRAIYRPSSLDLRNYKRLQMWVHEEAIENSQLELGNNDLSIFIRLGTDVKENYYEYEIPLTLTPPGLYSNESSSDRERVWPLSNLLDLELQRLVDLKRQRNREKTAGVAGVAYNQEYSQLDPDKLGAIMRVMGNPSLSNVRTMLVGVRNNTQRTLEATIWINELRVTDFESSGGWAAKVNAALGISDVAQVNFSGHIETDGFGSVDQSLNNRRLDRFENYSVAVQGDFGRFIPEKAKLRAPIYYSYSTQKTTPKYNPLDQDVLLEDAISDAGTEEQKQDIKDYSITQTTNENFSISGLKFDVQSEVPKPWDPGNFSVNFSFRRKNFHDPTTDHEYDNDYSGALLYSYSPMAHPWKPFKGLKSKNKNMRFFKEWELNYMPQNISLFNTITRHYFETQARAEFDYTMGTNRPLPVSASKNFYWNRQLNLTWNLTKSLNFSLETNTIARIEETVGAVNRKLFPDKYREWRDTVWQSILRMGTPWNYSQHFTASYKAPFNRVPILDWLTADASYQSQYTWDRGATVNGINVGNNIANSAAWNVNGRINFENIYNKINYTKEISKRFANTRANSRQPEKKPRKFERTMALKPDTTLTIRHNLRTKKIKVVATTTSGQPFDVRTRIVDPNTVVVLTKGTQNLKFTVNEVLQEDKTFWTELLAYSTRLLMSPRNVSVKWRRTNTATIPLYSPTVGNVFGQSLSNGPMAPGLGFAFGFETDAFLDKALDNNWLMTDGSQNSPAIFNKTEEFSFEVNLELFKGFKVQLTGNRTDNRTRSVQFMYDGLPTTYSGSYTKTHVALASAMRSYSDKDGYRSDAFEKFCDNIEVMRNRYLSQYEGAVYPTGGFIGESTPNFAGQPFNPAYGPSATSSDILIPAFLSAYTGTDPHKASMSIFPSIAQILPNWRITYDGFINLGNMRKIFKTFTLTHAYQCTYSVGGYNSHLTWISTGGSRSQTGYIYDELRGAPIPSSPYNVASVAITERFAPLIGLNVALNNGINVNAEWREQRTLTLNTSAGQLVEASTRGLTIGAGYVINNFNTILKLGSKQTGVNNDLTLQADISWQVTQALIRNIEGRYTQPTSGASTLGINFTANYQVSRRLTIGMFFDHKVNTPIVTNSAYPTQNSQYGININLSLAQ